MNACASLPFASQKACPFGQVSLREYREKGAKVWAKVDMLLIYLFSMFYRKFLASRVVLGG